MFQSELIPRIDGEKVRGGLGRFFQKPSPIEHKTYQHFPSERLTQKELSTLPRGGNRDAIVANILKRRADHRGAEASLVVAKSKLKRYTSWLQFSKDATKRTEYTTKIHEVTAEIDSAKQEVLRTNQLLDWSDRAIHDFL